MTREEAIYFANCLKNNYTVDLNDMEAFCDMAIKALAQEPTTKNDLGVEKIIDEIEQEFEKVDIPIMDKLTLFAKVQNSLYRCAELRKASEEAYNKGYADGVKSVNICPHCGEYIGEEE